MNPISDPLALYESKKGVCPTQTAFKAATVGSNREIITGIPGKRLRIIFKDMQSATAAQGSIIFKSASGGTQLRSAINAPANTANPLIYPLIENGDGYFDTLTGEGLFADIATADINLTVRYFAYTP